MKAIVGLGNPGKKYAATRHNVGFAVLDELARREMLRFKKSFVLKAVVAQKTILDECVLLVKPATFMNNSGECVKKVFRRYKLASSDVFFVYDDVDLGLGKMRFKSDGSTAGHKGMASAIAALGTNAIDRLRIGIGRPQSEAADIADYVLSRFLPQELTAINHAIARAAQCCYDWLREDDDYLMRTYNA